MDTCQHPKLRQYCYSNLDPESPTLESMFCACCDCGAVTYRGNWRLRQPTKAEIARDRANVLASLHPDARPFWEAA